MPTRATLFFLGSFAFIPLASPDAQLMPPAKALYTLSGIVRDEGGTPIANAEISLSRVNESARLFRTGDDGRFNFTEVRVGEALLSVRRLGYRATSMKFDVGPTTTAKPIEFELTEIASDIDAVVVEGSKGHLREFYEHKASNNFAKFFERKDIEKRNPAYLSELLRTVPGARLAASGRSGNEVLLRGCKPMVWVDGMRAPGAEVDEMARPMDIAGMEVYPSSAGLPPQYQDRNNRMCGAIVLWTRNQ
jgi:TonB-dependent Receptor Plug Domain.